MSLRGCRAPSLSLGLTRVPMARSIGPSDLPAPLTVARHLSPLEPYVVHAHGAKGGVYGRLARRWSGGRGAKSQPSTLRTAVVCITIKDRSPAGSTSG